MKIYGFAKIWCSHHIDIMLVLDQMYDFEAKFCPQNLAEAPPHPTFIRLHMLLCVDNRCHIKKSLKPKKVMRIYGFAKMLSFHHMLNFTKSAILRLNFVPKILQKHSHSRHSIRLHLLWCVEIRCHI